MFLFFWMDYFIIHACGNGTNERNDSVVISLNFDTFPYSLFVLVKTQNFMLFAKRINSYYKK